MYNKYMFMYKISLVLKQKFVNTYQIRSQNIIMSIAVQIQYIYNKVLWNITNKLMWSGVKVFSKLLMSMLQIRFFFCYLNIDFYCREL